jgi:hypothetical protein
MNARAVNIRVGRLTVPGPRFNRRETSQFRWAFERELIRLLRDRPPRPAGDAACRTLAAPMPPAPAGPQPASLGAQAARSFFDAIGLAARGQAR